MYVYTDNVEFNKIHHVVLDETKLFVNVANISKLSVTTEFRSN